MAVAVVVEEEKTTTRGPTRLKRQAGAWDAERRPACPMHVRGSTKMFAA